MNLVQSSVARGFLTALQRVFQDHRVPHWFSVTLQSALWGQPSNTNWVRPSQRCQCVLGRTGLVCNVIPGVVKRLSRHYRNHPIACSPRPSAWTNSPAAATPAHHWADCICLPGLRFPAGFSLKAEMNTSHHVWRSATKLLILFSLLAKTTRYRLHRPPSKQKAQDIAPRQQDCDTASQRQA